MVERSIAMAAKIWNSWTLFCGMERMAAWGCSMALIQAEMGWELNTALFRAHLVLLQTVLEIGQSSKMCWMVTIWPLQMGQFHLSIEISVMNLQRLAPILFKEWFISYCGLTLVCSTNVAQEMGASGLWKELELIFVDSSLRFQLKGLKMRLY